MMISYRIRMWTRTHGRSALLIFLVFILGFSLVYFGNIALTGWSVHSSATGQKFIPEHYLGDPRDLTAYTLIEVEVFDVGVLFRSGCTGVWMSMPYEKTFSIKRGEVGVFDIRPTQHDLMYDILTTYAINMTYARIERIQNDFYYATVLLENDDKILELDTRPSDALALATRFKAPVYIATSLLRQQGRDVCDGTSKTG